MERIQPARYGLQTSLGSIATLKQSIVVRDGETILNCAYRPLVARYDLSGRRVYQTSHNNRLSVPHPGTYIIRMGQEAVKVIVR